MPVWDEEADHLTPPVSSDDESTYEIKIEPEQREPDEDVIMGPQENASLREIDRDAQTRMSGGLRRRLAAQRKQVYKEPFKHCHISFFISSNSVGQFICTGYNHL